MFWGLVLTAAALAGMVLWALLQIVRVDHTIAKVDQELEQSKSADDA